MLLSGVDTAWHLLLTVTSATAAMLVSHRAAAGDLHAIVGVELPAERPSKEWLFLPAAALLLLLIMGLQRVRWRRSRK